jgi:hypothetical protein
VFIGPPATAITSMGSKRSVPSFTLSLSLMKSAKFSVNRRTSCLVCGCERNVVQEMTDEMQPQVSLVFQDIMATTRTPSIYSNKHPR